MINSGLLAYRPQSDMSFLAEVHRQDPLGQRRLRFVEDLTGLGRGLQPTVRALEMAPRRRPAIANATAARAHEPIRPAHRDQSGLALLLGPIAFMEIGEVQPLFETALDCAPSLSPARTRKPTSREKAGQGAARSPLRLQDVFVQMPLPCDATVTSC